MSDLFFINKITIYHIEDEENPIIEHFDKVYFRHTRKVNVIDKGIENASSGSITIPTTDDINVSNGDIVVEGIVNDVYDFRTLSSKYHLYRVLSVDDNRKGNLQHWKLGVSD